MTGIAVVFCELRPGLALRAGATGQELHGHPGGDHLAEGPDPYLVIGLPCLFLALAPVFGHAAEKGRVLVIEGRVAGGIEVVVEIVVRRADMTLRADLRAIGQVLGRRHAVAELVAVGPVLPLWQVMNSQPLPGPAVATFATDAIAVEIGLLCARQLRGQRMALQASPILFGAKHFTVRWLAIIPLDDLRARLGEDGV